MINRILQKTTKIEPHEFRSVILSFAFIFSILASYYIIRSVRDGLASNWTDAELSSIWTLTFFISFLVVSFYSYICSKISFKNLVPGIYGFFSITFFTFYALLVFYPEDQLIRQIFYIWVSVFSLLNISVFWSFMADIFNKEQAKRLFGFIAAGSSMGAILGPTITLLFVNQLGSETLILISSSMLFIPLVIAILLGKATSSNETLDQGRNDAAMGGNFWDGFLEFIKPPILKNLLFGIGMFIMIYTGMSTFVYFAIKNILTDIDQDTRTQIWAGIDLAVNILAVFTAMFGTARLTKKFGLAVTLPLVPTVIVFGMLILAISPILWVVVGLQVVRRAGEYSITKPAREMLFTTLDRDARFKGKSVIDVVVYRAGDIMWAWIFTGLTQVLGLTLGGVAAIGSAVALVWSYLGFRLGKHFDAE